MTTRLKVKPEVGFVNEFDFNEETLTKMKILELNKNESILWECVESNPEWVGTKVSFHLAEKNRATTLFLNHSGWRELTDCNNWSMFLKRLMKYCEEQITQY